jgi:hypothetical protein
MKERFILLLFLSGFLFSLLTPIDDPDFFWHLATGRWIYEHKRLPREDPFSYTTSLQTQEEVSAAKTMLTQYWLANLIQYEVYKAGNYRGIIALRLTISLCILLIVLLQLRENGLSIIASILLLIPLAYLLTVFKGDRPNQMTFLFLALFLFLLTSLKKGKKIGYLLPFALLVWANIHGGFILGTVICLIYIFSEVARWFLARGSIRVGAGSPHPYILISITVITVLAGMVNPNGYLSIFRLSLRQASFTYKTTENFSPFAYAHQGNYMLLFATISFFAFALFSIFWSVLVNAKGTPNKTNIIPSEARRQSLVFPLRKGGGRGLLFTERFRASRNDKRVMDQNFDKGFDISTPVSSRNNSRQNAFVFAISGSLEDLFLVFFLEGLALTAVRYLPLFAIAVTPIIGRTLVNKSGPRDTNEYKNKGLLNTLPLTPSPQGKVNNRSPLHWWERARVRGCGPTYELLSKKLSKFLVPEIVALVIFCFVAYKLYPATLLKKPVVGGDYPEAAVKFIKERGIEGRFFNYIDWGGYLIWNFYPEKVVFTDGRILSQKIKKLYLSVSNGDKESIMGEPTYQAVFHTYSVKHILIPPVDLTGYFLPLVSVLVNDPQWRLGFTSENSLLFTREQFEHVLPKNLAYYVAVRRSFYYIRSNPDNPEPYISIAKSYVCLGRRDEAVNFLRNALRRRHSLSEGPVERALMLLEERQM